MMSNSTLTATELLDLLCEPNDNLAIFKNSDFFKLTKKAKAKAVAHNDEQEAFEIWCAETIFSIQKGYITAFNSLKEGQFYEAWCQLERCEVALNSLNRHYTNTTQDIHKIRFIELMIQRWQSLYPYKAFFSPEYLKKRVECSICGTRVSPRANCGHEKFKIYSGEICHHIVVDVEVLGISMVENPVQRYSVAFLSQDGKRIDHYNYGNLIFIIERLDSAFHWWEYHKTTRTITASEVKHLANNHPCPCSSGIGFGECCSGKDEIIIPHLQVDFSVPPCKNLPESELLF